MRFEDLFRESYPLVCRLVRGFGIRGAAVEDVTQEVFIVLFRRQEAFEIGERSPRALLYAVARRVSANHRRKEAGRRSDLVFDDRASGAASSDERTLEIRAKARVVREALDRIDDDKRCVFVMVEVEGVSVKEFAASFGVNVNTAHARLRAARRSVAQAVQRHEKRSECRR